MAAISVIMEDILGYKAPTYNKPYKAYKYIDEKWTDWESLPDIWKGYVSIQFNNGEEIKDEEMVAKS